MYTRVSGMYIEDISRYKVTDTAAELIYLQL